MNQINLDKLLQPGAVAKADTAGLKLLVAQVYQAQVQLLTDGSAKLNVPQPSGALQVVMPAAVLPQLQRLINTPINQPAASLLTSPNSPLAQPIPMQVQFYPQPENNTVTLQITNSTAQISQPLNSKELSQLINQVLRQINLPAIDVTTEIGNESPRPNLAGSISVQQGRVTLQMPFTPPLHINNKVATTLTAILSASSQPQKIKLLLEMQGPGQQPELSLKIVSALPSLSLATGQNLLSPPQQQQLLQHLVKAFNQQAINVGQVRTQLSTNVVPSTTPANWLTQLAQPALTSAAQQSPQIPLKHPAAVILTASAPPLEVRLPLSQFNRIPQWIIPTKLSQTVNISADNVQPAITNLQAQNVKPSTTAAVSLPVLTQSQQNAMQQAWRQLLPLLPAQIDPLAELPELPAPVRQTLTLIRNSQLDGGKIWPASQLQPQLAAALAFSPLQTPAQTSTSTSTLAVAIQLLLGQLLSKNTKDSPVTTQNSALARHIGQLEPAQASSLLRQLSSHSSTLQQSQLATLDSSNGQQLILQLPLQLGTQTEYCQLMLEQREADGKQPHEKRTLWQLTMRFDLKQYGTMLVMAKLDEQQLKLQFYTDNTQAKRLTEKFLPVLKDRCITQGIKVEQAECVLGKIPESLIPRANSVFAVKV